MFLLTVREVIPSRDLWGKRTNNCTGNAPLTRGDAFGMVETFKEGMHKTMPGEDSWGNEENTREREKIDSERIREHTGRSLRKCTE